MSDAIVKLAVLSDHGQINLRGNAADATFLAAVKTATGCEVPIVPNTVAGSATQICWLGPDEWLLLTAADRASATCRELETELHGQHVSINDLSGGQLMLRLTGDNVRELLSKGCTLDLHPTVFGAGACAQTGVAKAAVIIVAHQTGAGVDLIVRRSFSDYLLQWLQKAGAEYRIKCTG